MANRTCPYCRSTVEQGESSAQCPTCAMAYHADCFIEGGGCVLQTCNTRSMAPGVASPPIASPTRDCPRCAKVLKTTVRFCTGCGLDVSTAQAPATVNAGGLQCARCRGVVREGVAFCTSCGLPQAMTIAPVAPGTTVDQASASTNSELVSVVDQISRLAEMHANGILSLEEFTAAKARLLS